MIDMEKYVVKIPAIGTLIDDNAFGGHYVDKWKQERMRAEAKRRWKDSIQAPLRLQSRAHTEKTPENPIPWMEYYTAPNPYFGWKEEQLKIVVEKKPRNLWNSEN